MDSTNGASQRRNAIAKAIIDNTGKLSNFYKFYFFRNGN